MVWGREQQGLIPPHPLPHRYLTRIFWNSDKLEMNGVRRAADAEEADSAEFLTFLHPLRTNHSPVK